MIGHQGNFKAHEADDGNFFASIRRLDYSSIWCHDFFGLASFTFWTIILGFSLHGLNPGKHWQAAPWSSRQEAYRGSGSGFESRPWAWVSRGEFVTLTLLGTAGVFSPFHQSSPACHPSLPSHGQAQEAIKDALSSLGTPLNTSLCLAGSHQDTPHILAVASHTPGAAFEHLAPLLCIWLLLGCGTGNFILCGPFSQLAYHWCGQDVILGILEDR
ncbi:hypothetical protein DSO57_1017508 [Entomophthora muscae]|uniref:Uncharacterized protein n=1 Tax=Entomophthora muscae TaxID=34485 RepID=A0ACC2SHA2_9FUNG|nr:hypothetical protein DSO57_1017508 [Entomophthora muscae]